MIDVEIEEPAWTAAVPDAEDACRQAARAAGAKNVVILLAGDEAVRALNARFRGKDAPTNVLSFPAAGAAQGHLGDIALAYGVCAKEAKQQGKPLAHHLQHLVIHGVLHLMGYDHEADADAERMEDRERKLLAGLGVPDPYGQGAPDGAMTSTADDRAPDPDQEGDKPGPLDALLSTIGLHRKAKPDARPAGEGAPHNQALADLVDQAEAFQTLRLSDVLTPRADITAVELSSPFDAVIAAFAESEHSRLPVYREVIDDPVGVVHLKDVFGLMAGKKPPAADEPVLHRLRRDTLYVPPSMRAADLLVRMQANRIHMAMVIDEFGGLDGLVTLEDLVEAVVGEIDDEHDEAVGTRIVARAGGIFEVDARAALEDLEAAVGRPLGTEETEDEDIDTAGGLVTALAGRVPQRGEVITHPAGFEIEITDADPRRVKRLRVSPAAARPEP